METLAVLVLILAANGIPVVLAGMLGPRWGWPLDGGLVAADGRPLLGSSKTLRGVIAGGSTPIVLAPVLGLDAEVGIAIGLAAMLGDLLSSFTKRRLGKQPSDTVPGLDQIPESLLPALAAASPLGLSLPHVLGISASFTALDLLLSRLLLVLHRRQPR